MMKAKNLFWVPAVLALFIMVSCGGEKRQASSSSSDLSDLSEAYESAKSELSDATNAAKSELSDATNAAKSELEGLLGSASGNSGGGNRKEIDAFFASYEAFIAKAEKAKSSNDAMAMLTLATQSADLSAKADKLSNNEAWTAADAKKLSDLSLKAMAALQ
jgi:hypothetical protein